MLAPERFRKKPVEVSAIQWTGENAEQVSAFVGRRHHGGKAFVPPHENLWATPKAIVWNSSQNEYNVVNVGDWIIRGVGGEFYPCESSVFEETYDAVGGGS